MTGEVPAAGNEPPAARPGIDERRDAFLRLIGVKPVVMGILNVTPDSFSDGGRFQSLDLALAQARRLAADGADIIDVGAESTRPGHTPVPLDDEWRRLEPVLAPLLAEVDAPFSIDTTKAEIARRAVVLGVSVVNDVWGLQKDPEMADVVAESGAALVIMHNRESIDPDLDVEADLRRFFERSLALANRAGIPRGRILLDPGIGFGKNKAQNSEGARADRQPALDLRPADPDRRLAQTPVRRSARLERRRPADRHARCQSRDARARRRRLPRP